ncbi:MAG: type IV pili methyl-accepting chemotaxis transducer N-terminal domain-containing protein [Litoreibacter sp.]|nr:type IV pili methyl-accepting chemotaxis transducer N-terminal domain-containing protein [Litoreibacter sp.]
MNQLTLCGRGLVLSAALAMSPNLAMAGEAENITLVSYSQDVGASERVAAAGLLRVLSQEAANAACHLGNGIAPQEAGALLTEVKAKFPLTLDALEFGNPTMNINGAESRRKTLEKISAVRAAWDDMKPAAFTLIDTPDDAAALAAVKAQNENLFNVAADLTNEIGGAYANPAELLQTDVLLLDFTSRQAMQTQRMGKLACALWSEGHSSETAEELTSAMGLYEATLSALINGMPAMGILAAPTPEISNGLSQASAAWGQVKSDLNLVLAGGEVDAALKERLFLELNAATRQMREVETLYVAYAKHKYLNKSDSSGTQALTD